MNRLVLVPPTPLLLRAYVGRVDPVVELRSATHEALRWLLEDAPPRVVALGDPADAAERARGMATGVAERVAADLLDAAGWGGARNFATTRAELDGPAAVLVMCNGSARRGPHAPGYVDDRSYEFDQTLVKALTDGDPGALAAADPVLGDELMASGIRALNLVGSTIQAVHGSSMLYADDPLGVQYWVATWECDARP